MFLQKNYSKLLLGSLFGILLIGSASAQDIQHTKEAQGIQYTKDTIVLAVGGENAEGYDPLLGWGVYGNPLFHSTLIKRDAKLRLKGDLATNWTLSEDGLTWTITLRDDVYFSDGKPLTARDVAFTFTEGMRSAGKVDLSPLVSAIAKDDSTVVFTLSRPDIIFFQHFISLGIVPAHGYSKDYARNPIGSGPYQFVRWDEGQQLVVEANPLYYGHKPSIGRLIFLFADESAALAAARAGQVDLVGVPATFAKQKLSNMHLHIVKSVDNRGLTFPMTANEGKKTPAGLPIGNDVTADRAIRLAVNYAIDKDMLVAGLLDGFGRPAHGVADDMPWDNIEARIADNNPEKAKEILSAAGWHDGDGDGVREKDGVKAEFSILYKASDSLRQGLALAVSDMLRPIGINAIPRGESWDKIRTELTHSNVVVYGFGDHSPLEIDKLYHTPTIPDPGYINAGFYSNPVVDAHLANARKAASQEEASIHWKKAQWDGTTGFSALGDVPWAWLVNLDHTYFVSNCLDIGESQVEPHGHGWPITANINEWQWTCK